MFKVIVYDYDAAPDADKMYFVGKRLTRNSLAEAKAEANYYVEEKFYVGAKVLDESGKDVYGVGLTLEES